LLVNKKIKRNLSLVLPKTLKGKKAVSRHGTDIDYKSPTVFDIGDETSIKPHQNMALSGSLPLKGIHSTANDPAIANCT